jgi:transposase
VRGHALGSRASGPVVLLPGYAPDLIPVEYLWAWLKRHALANFCPYTLAELKDTARRKLKSGQNANRSFTACWKQAELW